jgi:hypothetical protein
LNADVGDHVRLVHAVGLAHQPPSFIVPLGGLTPADLKAGLQTAIQASAGVRVDWPEVATATLTIFDGVFLNMSDTISTQSTADLTRAGGRTQGSAFGMELYLHRRLTRRLGGFLSYTLSRSTRTDGRTTFPSAFDRTHVFNTALAYELGRGFRAGARFTLYTGAPTLAAQGFHEASPQRDPSFYRLDLRVEKRWTFGASRWLSAVAEGLNVTAHKEIVGGEEIGPITIPSIGLEGGF